MRVDIHQHLWTEPMLEAKPPAAEALLQATTARLVQHDTGAAE
jgi:hypothetical protein